MKSKDILYRVIPDDDFDFEFGITDQSAKFFCSRKILSLRFFGRWYLKFVSYFLAIFLILPIAFIVDLCYFATIGVIFIVKEFLAFVWDLFTQVIKQLTAVIIQKVGGIALGIATFFIVIFLIFTLFKSGLWNSLYIDLVYFLEMLF